MVTPQVQVKTCLFEKLLQIKLISLWKEFITAGVLCKTFSIKSVNSVYDWNYMYSTSRGRINLSQTVYNKAAESRKELGA